MSDTTSQVRSEVGIVGPDGLIRTFEYEAVPETSTIGIGRQRSGPSPATAYRRLNVGEIIQDGDEWQAGAGEWQLCKRSIGNEVTHVECNRRPITGGAGLHEQATCPQTPPCEPPSEGRAYTLAERITGMRQMIDDYQRWLAEALGEFEPPLSEDEIRDMNGEPVSSNLPVIIAFFVGAITGVFLAWAFLAIQ